MLLLTFLWSILLGVYLLGCAIFGFETTTTFVFVMCVYGSSMNNLKEKNRG